MVHRTRYDEIIDDINRINSHHAGCDFEKSLSQLTDVRDNFDIKLMMVGHFSAGKSALLNALIGKVGFLKEAQAPQTAIATELKYDEFESAFAYDSEGNKEVFDADKEYSYKQYDYIEYRLNSSVLKEIGDFTIVDTPGFDAGIEAHTKALANYIGAGSAYLVVIDQEKGGIDQTTLNFIEEISKYSTQIAVLINKCDKITPETADSIAEAARFILMTHGFPYKVYTVSKRDEDISEKLKTIIMSFDAQYAFDKVMTHQIRTELLNVEKILSITKSKLYLDTYDMDQEIDRYSRLKDQLSEEFERNKKELNNELTNMVEEITGTIRGALTARSGSVAEALLSCNQVAAEAIIIETIRPIMYDAVKDISARQIDHITETLDFTGIVGESNNVDLLGVATNLAENIKNFIDMRQIDIKSIDDISGANDKKNVYRAVTGILAIATDVVAPWLEIAIILAPDIAKLLKGVFGDSDIDLVKRKFVNNIIPQIMNKVYPFVKENIEKTTAAVLDEYETSLREKIDSIMGNIIEVNNKKQNKVEEYETYKNVISEDLVEIKNIFSKLG